MRNALHSKTREGLAVAFEDVWLDDDIRVVVLTHGLKLARFFLKSPEMAERATAFMEKRRPDFYQTSNRTQKTMNKTELWKKPLTKPKNDFF